MNLKTLITHSVQYNHWVVNKYIDWLATKSDEQLNQEVISSFPTILATLHHIWQTQEYWWSYIAENNDFNPSENFTTLTKDEIFSGIKNNSEKLMKYVESLSEEDLVKNVKIESQWFQCDFSKYEYIQHIIIHGTFHRGQIVTMGRNVGITDAPMTDYNFWNIYKDADVITRN
ncbi:damage-inducible protein DinB [Chryseobacterium nematophagum]|uniref:Damage-inducible protein DinB n=1 Tax=Chryseobacterium nematophagum TaxID=2305228 RepID=A0A3M7TJH9_9FLAO|nr:DinB family protein [Chryseobacterium nematophagum]RNA63438.1 damage-inducible protein DinB [Chryseobacterium nematophagum]